ncbi:MAG: Gfo/Idh/MocA family oxidoreductase [Planctomycetes bacterium]|nr:Gfo/Idh/MocA family oxidoreductase [Planctomycetota bacterium]
MNTKIRWGILGTGNIAEQFAQSLTVLGDAELLAVGSRAEKTAKKFAKKFKIPRAYPSYEQLVNDKDIDVIYISTPHTLHMENTMLALNAGRAVLCEKPFAINTDQAMKMVDLAREKKLFLMEAMWTRFLPVITKVRQLLDEGIIGQPEYVQADFGYSCKRNPEHRILNPELGGGALLDVGVYCISFASMIFKSEPTSIKSTAHIGKTGVDEQSSMTLSYNDGQIAELECAINKDTPWQALIRGTKGEIKIHRPFWKATAANISIDGKEPQVLEIPLEGNGYNYQAADVMDCLRAGKTESDIMPLDETLSIMKTMDKIRAQWHLKYPCE